jgi:hypothetical protein
MFLRSGSAHIEDRKIVQDGTQFFIKRILGVLDFAHVKVAYSADFEVLVNDLDTQLASLLFSENFRSAYCRRLALSF